MPFTRVMLRASRPLSFLRASARARRALAGEQHVEKLEDRRLMSVVVDPLSNFEEFAVPPAAEPRVDARLAEMTAGADGNMWFTDPDAQMVGRVTPRGVVT